MRGGLTIETLKEFATGNALRAEAVDRAGLSVSIHTG